MERDRDGGGVPDNLEEKKAHKEDGLEMKANGLRDEKSLQT